MRVILIHGDHTLDSYQRLRKFIEEAKTRNWDVVRIDCSAVVSLAEEVSRSSLFQKEQFFVVENLDKVRKKDLAWLKKNIVNLPGTLVFFHQGVIKRDLLQSLPKPDKIEEFKLPRLIFKFLEAFYPGNEKSCLQLFHQVMKTEPHEFVFALLARHLRDLYWLKIDINALSYPHWRLSRLKAQSTRFSKSLLKGIIRDLAEIDVKTKTSKATCTDALDFLIASKLE
jgi:DNA polymerase III delta subunit